MNFRIFTRSFIALKNLVGSTDAKLLETMNTLRSGAKSFVSTNLTSVPKYETLSVTVPKPFVFHVELQRPEKRNAINDDMWQEFKVCFDELSCNADCRAVVLSGSGPVFCSGIDVQSFMSMGSKFADNPDVARKAKIIYRSIVAYQESFTAIEKCVKPVIAAVHGPCVGAGVDMITAADIRWCTKDAWFSVKEVDIGLAADVGTLQRLPKIVGSVSLARELVFTGRKLESQEAKECGLVNKVYDTKEELIEACLNLAAIISLKSPVAVQTAKRSMVYSQDRTVEDGLQHIAALNSAMLQSEDLTTAVINNVSKSEDPPQFAKL